MYLYTYNNCNYFKCYKNIRISFITPSYLINNLVKLVFLNNFLFNFYSHEDKLFQGEHEVRDWCYLLICATRVRLKSLFRSMQNKLYIHLIWTLFNSYVTSFSHEKRSVVVVSIFKHHCITKSLSKTNFVIFKQKPKWIGANQSSTSKIILSYQHFHRRPTILIVNIITKLFQQRKFNCSGTCNYQADKKIEQ